MGGVIIFKIPFTILGKKIASILGLAVFKEICKITYTLIFGKKIIYLFFYKKWVF
jgi:hypothetical protein